MMIPQSRCIAAPIQRRRGQSLIGLLVVGFLLIVLYMMFLGPRVGKNGESEHSVARQSIDRAKDTATTSNISQINQAIMMYKNDNDGKAPASLEEAKNSSYCKGFPPEMWVDSVSGKPLVYDPATGTVSAQGTGSPAGANTNNSSSPSSPGSNSAAPGAGGGGTTGPGGIKIPDMQPKVPSDGGDSQ